jgi:D-glycero-D-manno-heptose 1,7-bisphosphate phosphatase
MTTTNDRAVFFEKDGTLVEEGSYRADPKTMRLIPGAAEGLAKLRAAGYRLFIVSNQPGVARGLFRESALEPIVRRLEELLDAKDAAIDGFYYCPHHPDGRIRGYAVECRCRKPAPGLIDDACQEHGLDPLRSWMIGGAADDVEAGRRAGCRTVMIQSRESAGLGRETHLTARDLAKAADVILARERSEGHRVPQRAHGRNRGAVTPS